MMRLPVLDLGVEPRLAGDVRHQIRLEFQVYQFVLSRLEYLHISNIEWPL